MGYADMIRREHRNATSAGTLNQWTGRDRGRNGPIHVW